MTAEPNVLQRARRGIALIIVPLVSVVPLAGVPLVILWSLVISPHRVWPWRWLWTFICLGILFSAIQGSTQWFIAIVLAATLWFTVPRIYSGLKLDDVKVIATGSVVTVFGFFGLAFIQVIIGGAPQATLFTFHPNLAGTYTLLVASLGLFPQGGRTSASRGWRAAIIKVGLTACALGTLLLIASRAALIGLLLSAAIWSLAYLWHVALKQKVLVVSGIVIIVLLVFGFGTLIAPAWGGENENLMVNTGFEYSVAPWRLLDASTREPMSGTSVDSSSRYAVHLASDGGQQKLMEYLIPLDVSTGEVYTVSLDAFPLSNADARVHLRIDGMDSNNRRLVRLTTEGWDSSAFSDPQTRILLPSEPSNQWQRMVVKVPGIPAGVEALVISIEGVAEAGAHYQYGYVDNFQFERGGTSMTYIPGRRPGPWLYLGPATPRFLALAKDPVSALGGRVSAWQLALEIASYKPLTGYGLGKSESVFERYSEEWIPSPINHPHSSYLVWLLEGGTLLAIPLLLFLVGSLCSLLIGVVRRGSTSAMIAGAGTVAVLITGSMDTTLQHAGTLVLMWLLICGGLEHVSDERHEPAVD